MHTFTGIEKLRNWRQSVTGTVGFVPTMGALHDGHLSLVKASAEKCRNTVVSIYINPAQFAPGEDLENYPRNLQQDIEKLKLTDADVLFLPDDHLMYPENFSTFIFENHLSTRLEGKSRPAHFKGVTTVVGKLFNLVQPTYAFFGKKDAQQLRVIRKMTADLNFDVEIIPCEIIREPHGLAMSSRNEYLSSEERQRAGIIYRSLTEARDLLTRGERSAKVIKAFIHNTVLAEPLARIDYVSVADHHNLEEITGLIDRDILVSTAVFFSDVRLIDNFEFMIPK